MLGTAGRLLHTCQHEDEELSGVFLAAARIRQPRTLAGICGAPRYAQVGRIVEHLEATAEARMVLQVLDSRGITVPGEIRDQILARTDTAQLEAWGRKAAVAHSIDEIFGAVGNGRQDIPGAVCCPWRVARPQGRATRHLPTQRLAPRWRHSPCRSCRH